MQTRLKPGTAWLVKWDKQCDYHSSGMFAGREVAIKILPDQTGRQDHDETDFVFEGLISTYGWIRLYTDTLERCLVRRTVWRDSDEQAS
jgi:hypothetical protein